MDVLISGAGVAGPTLAYWLKRDGHEVLALAQALSTVLGLPLEERSWFFLIRLLAFSTLAIAILVKNLKT